MHSRCFFAFRFGGPSRHVVREIPIQIQQPSLGNFSQNCHPPNGIDEKSSGQDLPFRPVGQTHNCRAQVSRSKGRPASRKRTQKSVVTFLVRLPEILSNDSCTRSPYSEGIPQPKQPDNVRAMAAIYRDVPEEDSRPTLRNEAERDGCERDGVHHPDRQRLIRSLRFRPRLAEQQIGGQQRQWDHE